MSCAARLPRALRSAQPGSCLASARRRRPGSLWNAAVVLGALAALLSPPNRALAAGPGDPTRPEAGLERHRLSNGLRVVFEPRARSSSVAACVSYDAGFRNEPAQQAGTTYLLAQLMFRGSENITPGQHSAWLARRGGLPSSQTDADHSRFCSELPAGNLGLALWLEAERMKNLQISDSSLKTQRALASEAFHAGVHGTLYAHAEARLQELVYRGYAAYERGPLAVLADLPELRPELVRSFYRAHYGPNTAVLSVAGSFDAAEALRQAKEFFGDAEPIAAAPYSPPPFLPEQTSPRRYRVRDQVPGYALYRGWAIGPTRDRDHYALVLASQVLGSGEASRLHQTLVGELGWAQSVAAWTDNRRGPDMLAVRVVLSEHGQLSAVKTWLNEALLKLGNSGPTTRELARAKARVDAAFTRRLRSSRSRAADLGKFELFWGDASEARSERSRYRAVTRQQVRRAIRRYLAPQRMNEVVVEPALVSAEPQATLSSELRGHNPQPPTPAAPPR